MPAGRPLKFKTPAHLHAACEQYFKEKTGWQQFGTYQVDGVEKPVIKWMPATITGLAVALDTNRQTLCNYRDRPEFFDILARALARCEEHLEVGALIGQLNAQFAKHSSQNNYDWVDKSEQKVRLDANIDLSKASDEELSKLASGQ
jgi:hypothetical protein